MHQQGSFKNTTLTKNYSFTEWSYKTKHRDTLDTGVIYHQGCDYGRAWNVTTMTVMCAMT